MNLLEHSHVYWELAGQCTQCGNCRGACASLTSADMTLGEIARALLSAERGATSKADLRARIAENSQLVQAVRGCFFCTSCKNTCFAHNDVCNLNYHARIDFQNLELIPRNAWSSVQVDQEWDIFTAYRAIYGIDLTDLTRHLATDEQEASATDEQRAGVDLEQSASATEEQRAGVDLEQSVSAHFEQEASATFEVAFFPGCSMAAYAPELTREIFTTVEELGGKATMIDHCCGSSLKSAGFYARAEALCNRIAGEVESSGAKEIICVCPGCTNDITTTFARRGLDVQVRSLSAFLAEHSFSPKRPLPQTPLCLSKSCQDRDGSYLEETCAALGIDPKTPTVFKGCCGAGGAVSAFDPNQQTQQVAKKLSGIEEGSTVVTMCPTCTYTYAFDLMGNPRNLVNKHYTELLFESQFNWNAVFAQLGGMWSGEYGAWLAEVFA